MSEKSIFVISDLHIGDGGTRDNFGHRDSNRPQQLTQFLDYVTEQDGELIIVGDLLEFWQANFSKVIVANLPLLDRMAELKATYVLGNHDADLFHFIGQDVLSHPLFVGMSGPVARNISGKVFKFMPPFSTGSTVSRDPIPLSLKRLERGTTDDPRAQPDQS